MEEPIKFDVYFNGNVVGTATVNNQKELTRLHEIQFDPSNSSHDHLILIPQEKE
jgi:hypothetical protein